MIMEATPIQMPAALSGAASVVQLRDVCLSFPGDIAVLRGVSLEVGPATRLTIVGASGGGKSTLLSVIAGRLRPTCGEVRTVGRVATIYQDLRLVKQKTAMQNVLHGALGRRPLLQTVFGFPLEETKRAAALLARVGLEHRLHAPVGRLSGGEQQRVAIARALMQDPATLLADEPVASLDPGNARAIMQLLSDLQAERGLTLVTVLHDPQLAQRYSDCVVRMDAGQLAVERESAAEEDAHPVTLEPASHNCAADCGKPPSPAGEKFKLWTIGGLFLAIVAWSAWAFDFSDGSLDGLLGRLIEFAVRLVPHNSQQLASIDYVGLGRSLLATFQMVMLGTTVAVVVSWPLAALAAHNVGPRYVRSIVRVLLNLIRAVPSIIWALLFVCAVGLGPVAGVMALIAYSIGYLTKFFYEAFEGADPGPQGALREIGASGPQCFLHAVWPASRSAVLSNCIFMIEYNVRAASVLGVVGAGGIGYDLKIHVEYGNYHVVGTIIVLLLVIVEVMDRLSRYLRTRMIKA